MTDLSEIERLLNQTGRTLEGLPERYDIVRWNRAANMPGAPLDIICHQSDVIELLVGALRDALDKPMQQPMTLEELKTETTDSYVWEERRTDLNIYFERISALVLAFMCVNSKEDMYKYGSSVRAWKKMPTDEERSAAAWEI